jgi:Pyridoxamine 5'-phosphate oxidase
MPVIEGGISPELRRWIEAQHMFFVASAPLAADGHVNVSPKGGDTFRILDEDTVAYLDLTGSGVETIAHLAENGRVTVMFCAFEGRPKIVRLLGRGEVVCPTDDEFVRLVSLFPDLPGIRSVIRIHIDRMASSCGFGVPLMTFEADRAEMREWAERKGTDGLVEYRATRNAESVDGLPGLGSTSRRVS